MEADARDCDDELTMAWNPAQYLQFEGERLRPALDLLARIPLEHPRTIVDLGCGAGNVTRMLGERWPDARIIGVDNSPEMLSKGPRCAARSIATHSSRRTLPRWRPDAPVDLVYSNAALHWLPDHAALFARVAAMVARRRRAGRADAGQFPRAVAHVDRGPRARRRAGMRSSRRSCASRPWRPPAEYFDWLSPVTIDARHLADRIPAGACCRATTANTGGRVDQGHVAGAVPGGAGRAGRRREFLRDYAQRLARAYPARADGRTLFPFRRLFIVANR